MYAENPTFSQRYRLTKKVPGLRAYELSVVWCYERALAEYVRGRFVGRRDGTLQAYVIAAAVVAAHSNALRSWLRSDGQRDTTAAVDHALGYMRDTYGSPPPDAPDSEPEDVVVAISQRGTPMWRAVQEIESTLGRD